MIVGANKITTFCSDNFKHSKFAKLMYAVLAATQHDCARIHTPRPPTQRSSKRLHIWVHPSIQRQSCLPLYT